MTEPEAVDGFRCVYSQTSGPAIDNPRLYQGPGVHTVIGETDSVKSTETLDKNRVKWLNRAGNALFLLGVVSFIAGAVFLGDGDSDSGLISFVAGLILMTGSMAIDTKIVNNEYKKLTGNSLPLSLYPFPILALRYIAKKHSEDLARANLEEHPRLFSFRESIERRRSTVDPFIN